MEWIVRAMLRSDAALWCQCNRQCDGEKRPLKALDGAESLSWSVTAVPRQLLVRRGVAPVCVAAARTCGSAVYVPHHVMSLQPDAKQQRRMRLSNTILLRRFRMEGWRNVRRRRAGGGRGVRQASGRGEGGQLNEGDRV